MLVHIGGKYVCSGCSGVNFYAGIQKATRGGDEFIGYKMARYAHKNRVDGFCFPFNFYDYKRPPRYRHEKWSRVMLILQALESMRNQSIFFKKIWNTKIIQCVERGEHEAVQPMKYSPYYHLKLFHALDGKRVDYGQLYAQLKG